MRKVTAPTPIHGNFSRSLYIFFNIFMILKFLFVEHFIHNFEICICKIEKKDSYFIRNFENS